MAASVKDKNMPTISSNLYGGLQKWVNRASLSIRDRKRSRRNSDASQTMYKPSPLETYGYPDNSPPNFVPAHVRSRSAPVEIPEQENYLNLERNYRETSEVTKRDPLQKEALLEPWRRQESKVDTSSHQEGKPTVGSRTLSRGFSKSESSLIEATLNSVESLRSKSQTTPPKYRVSRTSSQNTEESFESYTSDLDINCNIDKKSRSSQAPRKANKLDGTFKPSDNLWKTSSHNKLAKDIKHRLDKWVEKSTGLKDSQQSSFDSTSSSDEPSVSFLLSKENKPAISSETREMRELQTALEDLVSSCGRNSRKSSEPEQRRGSMSATNTGAIRKVSLQNAGAMFSKGVETDDHCSQSVLQNEYRLKKCGSSSCSTGSGDSITDEIIEENNYETNSELEVSYESVDEKRMENEGVRVTEYAERCDMNILNRDPDIGPGPKDTRTLSTSPDILESELSNKNHHVSPSVTKCQNEDERECKQKKQQAQYYDQEDNSPSSNETKQTIKETNEQVCKQNPVGGMDDENEDANQAKIPAKSTKSYRAPPPPSRSAKESPSQEKKHSNVTFNDVGLDAFAAECLRQASDNKKPKRKERERASKSDSEEEKRSLEINFIYIKDEAPQKQSLAYSYPEQPGHVLQKKASTHPKTSFDENHLSYIASSDNDWERNRSPSKSGIRQKRNSVDSLDGRILFDMVPQDDVDTRHVQSAEDDLSSDSLQNEEDLATEVPAGTGMRKFPSMPLFYVPKEFDHSTEFKTNKSSIRKSIWKRIKGLPQKSENRVNQNIKSKKKEEEISPPQFLDPFYHGDKIEQDLAPEMRAKAWTLNTTKIYRPVSQRRPFLETRRSAPLLKVANTEQKLEPDRLLNDYIVVPPKDEESQC